MEHFSTIKEAQDWVASKVGDGVPEHPDRIHASNWFLSEFYYYHNKGQDLSKRCQVKEELDKTAADSSSATLFLTGGDCGKNNRKKEVPVAERYKVMSGKVNAGLARLSKAINGAENQVPSLKRMLDAEQMAILKRGIHAVRERKEMALDEF